MTLTATQIPTKAEVNLRRLLAVCEKQASEEISLIRGPDKNIRYLRKLLEQIEKDANIKQIDKTAISEYSRKIQQLSNIVDENKLKSPVTRTFSQARFINHANQTQTEKNKENQLELKMVRQAEKEQKEELLQPPTHTFTREPEEMKTYSEKRTELFSSEASGSEIRQRRVNTFDPEDTTNIEGVLQHHRKTQEELTNDLVKMVERLKLNSETFGNILIRDEKIIDEAQNVVGSNLDRLKREGNRLGKYAARSSKTTWLVWSVILFVCITCVLMFMLIRITPKG
ncbi:vesicle transport protein [Glomus cerebriforme]|uniref:Vesicle transport protein n=1 Tax=Glomus cerebriforme TaxID=658196 RepID=A0A397TIW5_9GLOM|nr:vesicle transport protein [Glomus cerebriforme]